MTSSFVVTDLMRELAAALDADGACSGCDYYVRGIPTEWALSDGAAGLSFDGVTFSVELRGPVTQRVLDTADFSAARAAFVSAAAAARHRPDRKIGPRSAPTRTTRPPSERGLANVLAALVGGVLGGLLCGLVFPIGIAIALFLAGPNGNSTSFGSGSTRPATPWRKRPFSPSRIGFWLGFLIGVAGCLAAVIWWKLHR